MKRNPEDFHYPSMDAKTNIHGLIWVPDQEVVAILQIAHGMVEYIERYDEFATYLNQKGILVVGNDHLGHGTSVRTKDEYGFFGDKTGSDILIQDMHTLRRQIQRDYPNVPYFMLGHSMGSFLVRKYITRYEKGLAGVILMGTGSFPSMALKIGKAWTHIGARLYGWKYPAKRLNGFLFSKKGSKDDYSGSWLSKDIELIRRYKEDKRSQFIFTYNGYYCLFDTIEYLNKKGNNKHIDKTVPILVLSGLEDKLGAKGYGVKQVCHQLKRYGVQDIQMQLFPGDRHELLNETDRWNVYRLIEKWMMKRRN